MNDHTPYEHDDLDGPGADAASVARLRRTLATVAAATPVRDRTDDLLLAISPDARFDDEDDDATTTTALDTSDEERPAIELHPATPARRTSMPWLLSAAAAAVVVAVLLVGGLLARGGDGGAPVVADDPDAPATGWFLPPAGWDITSVRTDYLDVPVCPCTRWVTVREGDAPAVIDVLEADVASENVVEGVDGARDLDVAGHAGSIVTSPAGPAGDLIQLVVEVDDRRVTVAGSRVTEDEVVALAAAWVTRLASGEAVDVDALPQPDGFTAAEPITQPDWANVHALVVTMRRAEDGTVYAYIVTPSGWGRDALHLATAATVVPGGVRVEADGDLRGMDGSQAGIVGGQYDLALGDSFFGDPIDAMSLAEVNELLDGFRQVSAAEWRDALAAADADGAVDPEVLAAESLYATPLTDTPIDDAP